VGGEATIEALERWEEFGAIWRLVDISRDRAVVELSTCAGERIDRLEAVSPEVVEWVRARGASFVNP
jgi:hypothetical protein